MLAAAVAVAVSCGKVTKPVDADEFVLELIWLGTPPAPEVRAAFDAAGNKIRATITGPLTAVGLPSSFKNLSDCGLPGHPDISREHIRGVRIYAVVEPIDTVGGTLGKAGPCIIRNNDIPALGVMRFDSWDVDALLGAGRLTRVVLHEMLHVLGFGTVWTDQFLIDKSNLNDARFTGANARAACQVSNGGATVCASSVPVHSADGEGSAYSHWREGVFGSELMTPFLGAGTTPYSATTIGSLKDLGYEVDFNEAETYTIPAPAPALRAGAPAQPLVEFGEPIRPRWKIDGAGRLVPYRPRR